jgi:hypothetical protein
LLNLREKLINRSEEAKLYTITYSEVNAIGSIMTSSDSKPSGDEEFNMASPDIICK